jgi:hypothetical protein
MPLFTIYKLSKLTLIHNLKIVNTGCGCAMCERDTINRKSYISYRIPRIVFLVSKKEVNYESFNCNQSYDHFTRS